MLLILSIAILYSCISQVFVLERYCEWDLTVQAWEDFDSNGIRDSEEPAFESIAILHWFTWRGPPESPPYISGSDQDGQVVLLGRGIGNCPIRVRVQAIAPRGYVATTPDQVVVTEKSATSIRFGFHLQPGYSPIDFAAGSAKCKADSFRYSGAVTGAELSSNGDIWVTSKHNGGVTLRKDGEDYPQDIDYFGSYADDLAVAPDGAIWVAGGPRTGVARFDGKFWKTYTTAFGALPSNDVSDVEVTRDGHVWALTSVGPADFNPISGRWRSYADIGNGFSLLSGPENVLWLVAENALISFQAQAPRDTARRIAVQLDSVSSVEIWNGAISGDGSVWLVGHADGWPTVVHYEPSADHWTNYTYLTTRGAMPFDNFNSVGVLSDGSVLLGADNRGAIRLIPNGNPERAEWMIYPALIEYAREGGGRLSVLSVFPAEEVWFSYGSYGRVLICTLEY